MAYTLNLTHIDHTIRSLTLYFRHIGTYLDARVDIIERL